MTNKKMMEIMNARRAGTYNYFDLLPFYKDNSKRIALSKEFDDIVLQSFRNANNFEIKSSVSLGTVLSVAGDIMNCLQLVLYMQINKKVSPLDILGAIPHPASLFAVLADMYITDMVEKVETLHLEEAPNRGIIDNWNKQEPLYMYYTDQNQYHNPTIQPTSLVIPFYAQSFAQTVFGFKPTFINFDLKNTINDDFESWYLYFNPRKQVYFK
ncbi:MAG: hypothetical protein IPO21_09200 [Bacteroidales bacterium]|nr:hypothetical protein [Bacteroidales bacterium]